MALIYWLRQPTASDIAELAKVWELSVRATHTFLTEADIVALRPAATDAIAQTQYLIAAYDAEAIGFIGVTDGHIDMLFVHPCCRGQHLGRNLLSVATVECATLRSVDVNEQNVDALGFYEHLGFQVIGRSPTDDAGRPFPLLHLAIEDYDAFLRKL